ARCACPSASSTSGSLSSADSQAFQQAFAAGEPPAVLLRPLCEFGIGAERGRSVQRPVGIEERLASDGDEVGAALLQRLLGLLRGEDQADRHGGDTGFFPDPVGERQLKARNPLEQGSSRRGGGA